MTQGILVLEPAQLLHRLRIGEPAALDEVVRSLGPKLYNFIYRMTGDRHAAEDLAQEVFVKLLRQAPKFKEGDSLSAWMFTVARNQTLNHLRGRRAAARHLPLPPENARAPADAAEKKEMVERIQAAII